MGNTDNEAVRAELDRRIKAAGSLSAVARELGVPPTTLASVAAGAARRGSVSLVSERLAQSSGRAKP